MSESTAEVKPPPIGPFNKTSKASMKRFEARQAHKMSTEGRVISAAREAEIGIRKDQKDMKPEPDVVEEHATPGFWRTKVTTVKKWVKKDK